MQLYQEDRLSYSASVYSVHITFKIGTYDATLGTVTSPSKMLTPTSQLLTSLPGAPENSFGSVKALANCPFSRHTEAPETHLAHCPVEGGRQ